jgi:serine/threonine protein kinase
LNAKYKFTCFLSKEAKSLIENILVPDPNLRYGLKQITSNVWFKTKFKPTVAILPGTKVGIDEQPLYSNVLH